MARRPSRERRRTAQVPLEVLRRLKAKMDGTDKEEKKKKQIEEDEEAARANSLCGVCESVLSPILRSDTSSWRSMYTLSMVLPPCSR